jgi:ATP-dependent protease Clp ATPase subunit
MSDQPRKTVYCSFCARGEHELDGVLIQGFDVAICQGCVKVCVDIVFGHSANRTKVQVEPHAEEAQP